MRRILAILILFSGCATAEPLRATALLRAGTAKVKITPEKMGWMTGYGNRNKPAEGVKADLHARVLVLDDNLGGRMVLVTADILGFPPVLNQSIRKAAKGRFGLKDGQLMLVASHTHGGPALPNRPSMEIFHGLDETTGKSIFEYADFLQERILSGIVEALGTLKPAQLTFSRGAATFGMNRRFKNDNKSFSIKDNPQGVNDPDVPVLRVVSDGGPLATVFTYACHCTTLGGNVYEYHGDYAGVAMRELEKDGGLALFATGCGADINPSPRGTFELAEKHGAALAAAVRAAPPGEGVGVPFRTKYRVIDLPLEKAPARALVESLKDDKNVFRARHSREMLRLMDAGKLPSAVPLPIQAWHFGPDLTLVAIGGETCVEYALRLKHELGPARTWVVGYANEVPCYIPSEKVLAEGGYEAGWDATHQRALAAGSIMYYGWPVPIAPGVEDRIIKAMHELIRE